MFQHSDEYRGAENGNKQLAVSELRRKWKPKKLARNHNYADHPTSIRVHRACSWLQQFEESEKNQDTALINIWVAFNALYGKWDTEIQQPENDKSSWKDFIQKIVEKDADGLLTNVLQNHKAVILNILEDEYLSAYLCQQSACQPNNSNGLLLNARTSFIYGEWTNILEHLIERIYLLRCKLNFGAAIRGSRISSAMLTQCAELLSVIVYTSIEVIIYHGTDEDWGEICYPPLEHAAQPIHDYALVEEISP